MTWDYRRIDRLGMVVVGVWVFIASFLSPLRSQITIRDAETPLLDACLCSGEDSDLPLLAFAATVALLAGVTATLGRRFVVPVFATAAAGWLLFSMWAAAFIASYYAGSRLRNGPALAYLILGPALLVAPAFVSAARGFTPVRPTLVYALMVCLFLIFTPFFYGRWVRARRGMQSELQTIRTQQARVLERGRIAREMHDVVAHRVALMVLHAGALELRARDEPTRETAELIRTIGRHAMTELRQVLGVLRGPRPDGPQPRLDDIASLVEETRSAGVPVSLQISGDEVSIPSTVERTAYRVVQEGLTNALKHAGRAPTEVLVHHGPQELTVTVTNGPPQRRIEQLPSSGLGLVGLRERVELLEGTFEAGAQPGGGFRIRARMPVHPTEAMT